MADRTCSVEGCEGKHHARGMCVKHCHRAYARERGVKPRGTVEERFWSKVDTSGGPDACWPWTGAMGRGKDGYGRFRIGGRADGRLYRAPRWLLGHLRGRELSSEEQACHRCDNPPCVNPAHLYVGNQSTNNRDMYERHRVPLESRGVVHRSKTHCPQGHPYDEANTLLRRNGGRDCRECARLRASRYYYANVAVRS